MKTIFPILASILALAGVSIAGTTQPNVVILYADDMGFGDLGVQNPDSKIPTPHLDQLARGGTRFTDAHSSSGVCTPSRYALLNGRYHWRKFHGIVNSFDQPIMDEGRLTIAEMLRQRGYETACIGKWHLGWDWESIKRPEAVPLGEAKKKAFSPDAFDWSKPIAGGPLSHGFDYYFGDDVPNFPPYAWFENDRVITEPTVSLTTTAPTAEGSWEARPGPSVKDWDFWAVMPLLTDKAVAWIGDRDKAKPFFLYFPFTSPHAPIVPTKEFEGSSAANGYGDFMVQTDATVGRVLKALEDGGLTENTLVIFTSDNGPEHYAYDRVRNYGHRSMGPLRGLKRDIWEGGHRVPFIVRWPGAVPADHVSDGLLSQVDLHATIAAAVGFELPENAAEDSYNQLELWTGKSPSARDTLVHNTAADGYAVRQGDFVLIDKKTGGISKVPAWFDEADGYSQNGQAGELYDLGKDLSQKHNLYSEMPKKVSAMQATLKHLREHGQVRELAP